VVTDFMEHTQITEHVWCGGELGPGDWERLCRLGVRYDLSLQAEKRDGFGALPPRGELWLPAEDWFMPSLEQLGMAALYIGGVVDLGQGIVVHCQHGIGRAPMTVACYLVSEGMDPDEAIRFLRQRRPIVDPNPGQVVVVRQFATRVRAGDLPLLTRRPVPCPTSPTCCCTSAAAPAPPPFSSSS
jgi:hypothetical protein